MIEKNSKIYVAGHRGMVGSAIVRRLINEGYKNIICRTSKELDLRNQNEVEEFFKYERPEYVILAAAKVGGIQANIKMPADYLIENLQIQTNVIYSSFKYNVKKLLFLGSSCIYPTNAPQPLKEEYLLTSPLEPTNEGYAIAKIAGLKMCEYYNKQYNKNFISIMPCNLYGINDNFNLENSHVMAALIRKFHEGKVNNLPYVTVFGTGNQYREFMYIDDLAEGAIFLMNNYSEKGFINIGTGTDITIKELSYKIKEIVGYKGEILFDTSKPDGMNRKLLDISKINELGWKSNTSLDDGIKKTYDYYLKILSNKE